MIAVTLLHFAEIRLVARRGRWRQDTLKNNGCNISCKGANPSEMTSGDRKGWHKNTLQYGLQPRTQKGTFVCVHKDERPIIEVCRAVTTALMPKCVVTVGWLSSSLVKDSMSVARPRVPLKQIKFFSGFTETPSHKYYAIQPVISSRTPTLDRRAGAVFRAGQDIGRDNNITTLRSPLLKLFSKVSTVIGILCHHGCRPRMSRTTSRQTPPKLGMLRNPVETPTDADSSKYFKIMYSSGNVSGALPYRVQRLRGSRRRM
ncbi:hypothetical protein GOBAR_AA19821 [Gossypium barbadense]|uniref:Uncharacterized protein n=1 Tax=Gossypium barbadense TaxID=3634 RepID=A0A2P5XBY2_GOSBA|nr:hypothetical protein GOBAR_AA19821 [Gossypium barbadense]